MFLITGIVVLGLAVFGLTLWLLLLRRSDPTSRFVKSIELGSFILGLGGFVLALHSVLELEERVELALSSTIQAFTAERVRLGASGIVAVYCDFSASSFTPSLQTTEEFQKVADCEHLREWFNEFSYLSHLARIRKLEWDPMAESLSLMVTDINRDIVAHNGNVSDTDERLLTNALRGDEARSAEISFALRLLTLLMLAVGIGAGLACRSYELVVAHRNRLPAALDERLP